MTITIYNGFIEKLFGGIDLSTLAMKAALLNSTYVPAKQHTTFASINSYEVTGPGYTTGGQDLTGVSVSELIGQDAFRVDADDVSWTESTITARVVTLYEDVSDDLICSFYMDADEVSSNGLFEIQWHTDGVIKVSQQVV